MTKAKRRIWAGTNHDLAAANHRTVTRVTGSIPSAPDAGARLAAVQAAAATRKHPKKGKMIPMHDAVRKDLVLRLQRLSSDEREQLFAEAAAENTTEAGKDAAASALAHLIRPNRKD